MCVNEGRGAVEAYRGRPSERLQMRRCSEARRSRRSGAPAVEQGVLGDVPGSGECACALVESGGGVARPESRVDDGRSCGGVERNWGGLGRASARCQRGNIEETRAFTSA